ncbi:hypothetical protein J3A64_001827 [Pseudarthrobacter sp. PvP004]|uniref:helix-turn-helix domain-containing protein n=1 Tax=Pseudarthrobacter sp. PvP004 TaxID=2817850 RepID=UPI0035A8A30E|nr:hypothetical protein [Pseudarthrobacter sp. PvP004]
MDLPMKAVSASTKDGYGYMKQVSADGVRSVERAASIIQVVADAGETGTRLTDIALKTGMSKTTIHRLLGTLLKVGWLDQEEDSSTFYLGLPLVTIGSTASDRHGLMDLAAPTLSVWPSSPEIPCTLLSGRAPRRYVWTGLSGASRSGQSHCGSAIAGHEERVREVWRFSPASRKS